MRTAIFILLALYSLGLLYVELTGGQAAVRPYVTDIMGEVRFYAIHTSLSVGVLAACAGLNVLIVGLLRRAQATWRDYAFHTTQVLVFAYLACDDRFLIHEELGSRFNFEDALFLAAIGLFELVIIWRWGRLADRSPTARRILVMACAGFAAMIVIDAFLPSELMFRLALEDLCKLWAGTLLLLFHWELYDQWLSIVAREPSPDPQRGSSPTATAAIHSLIGDATKTSVLYTGLFGLSRTTSRLFMLIAVVVLLLSAAHTISEVLVYTGQMPLRLQLYVDMDHEGNLPTWLSGLLLFCCAQACFALSMVRADASRKKFNTPKLWRVATVGFVLLSLDEVIQLHEVFERNYFGLGLAHHWYYYVAPIALPFAALALWIAWRALEPEPNARRCVARGAALFLTAAIGIESLRNLFEEGALLEGVGELMLVQIVLEESGEMIGVALILVGLTEAFLLRVNARHETAPILGDAILPVSDSRQAA
ncbi:MAG: hypothetical protein ACI835_002510 [Planctomycetota bacterium]